MSAQQLRSVRQAMSELCELLGLPPRTIRFTIHADFQDDIFTVHCESYTDPIVIDGEEALREFRKCKLVPIEEEPE